MIIYNYYYNDIEREQNNECKYLLEILLVLQTIFITISHNRIIRTVTSNFQKSA